MHWFEWLLNWNLNMHACMKCVPPYVQQASNHSHNVTPKALFLSEPIYTKLILMLIVLFIDLCYISVDSFFLIFICWIMGPSFLLYDSCSFSDVYTLSNGSKTAPIEPVSLLFFTNFSPNHVLSVHGRSGRSTLIINPNKISFHVQTRYIFKHEIFFYNILLQQFFSSFYVSLIHDHCF